MGKLDELRRSAVSNIDESMGGGRSEVIPRVLVGGPRSAPARLQGITRSNDVAQIPVEKIAPDPDQPREEFDPESISRLAESLKTRGQLQPIRVRWVEEISLYTIVCGERRWRAATLAGLPTMSCVIMDAPASPSELLALQLVENLLREDLRPLEQAKGFRSLMDANGWSGNQLAKALGIAQPSVVRTLALLDLPTVVQDQVEQGSLAPATAYELSKIEDPEEQRELAARVVTEKLNRAETVEAVKQISQGNPRKSRGEGKASGKPTSKAKGKPTRLPAELKHKGPAGCKVTITTAARHTLADVVADLEVIVARLRAELDTTAQDAA
jgi:ParB family chromosome partitioning protein